MATSCAQHVTTEGRSKFKDLESTKNVATIQASPVGAVFSRAAPVRVQFGIADHVKIKKEPAKTDSGTEHKM